MITTLIPMFDRLTVQRDEAASVTQGGVIIPDQAKSRMNTGTVLAVGEGRLCPAIGIEEMDGSLQKWCHVEPLRVKQGDRILFSAYGGVEIELDGAKLLFLKEDEVIAIIKETESVPTPSPTA